jgi:hypothetical protein
MERVRVEEGGIMRSESDLKHRVIRIEAVLEDMRKSLDVFAADKKWDEKQRVINRGDDAR